jgi:hypothetical protein
MNSKPKMNFLRELNFPKGTDAFMKPLFEGSIITDLSLDRLKLGQDKQFVEEGFLYLEDVEEWMLECDPRLDDIFRVAFPHLEVERARLMIQYQRYQELEKHLENMRNILGSGWKNFVDDMRKPSVFTERNQNIDDLSQSNKARINTILELPAPANGIEPFNGIIVSHNLDEEIFNKLQSTLQERKVRSSLPRNSALPKNAWMLYNADAQVASGSLAPAVGESSDNTEITELLERIHEVDHKNFLALKQFVRLNPEHIDAIDILCADAAKFLPDEELGKELLRYARQTRTPPSPEAYSKMNNKDDWSSLAAREIREGLSRLSDVPTDELKNPWLNLSRWEDLDPQKNRIDWHSFLKDTVFWYAPEYYFYPFGAPMPGPVLIKYLNCAELAKDWNAVLVACRRRYSWDKKYPRMDEKISAAWEKAESMLKNPE